MTMPTLTLTMAPQNLQLLLAVYCTSVERYVVF
jgi:hypothetical protein